MATLSEQEIEQLFNNIAGDLGVKFGALGEAGQAEIGRAHV